MYNGAYSQYGQASAPAPHQMGTFGQAPLSQYYQQPQQHQPLQPQVGHPPVSAPYYHQQQQQLAIPNPALQIATDPNAFAQMFKSHLAALTFNSKPIITDLTLISHEHVTRMAHVVAQCLEEHVLTCAPSFRLPALYTIDSICKNVGLPYTTLWSDRMARIFLDTYRIVDQSVKVRMEELLATWRNAGINGTTLFGDTAQFRIEQAIYGSVMPQTTPVPAPMAPFQSTIRSPMIYQSQGNRSPMPHYQQQQQEQQQPTQQQLQKTRTIDRLNRLLAIGSHDQHHNPHLYDDTRMQALTKLRSLVTDMPLSVEEMNQIELQLNVLEGEVEARRGAPIPLQGANATPSATISPRLDGNVNLPQSLVGALANFGNLASTTPPLNHTALAPSTGTQSVSGNTTSASSAQSLIASLRQAGLLPTDKALATPPPSIPIIEQDLEYSNMIMSLNMKLTSADMQRDLPLGSLEAIHFQELPLQCRQCANRYPAGSKGQASMDQHLDWHFRQNRRAKDSAVRGQSRSWFSKLEDWIRGGHDDEGQAKGDGMSIDKGNSNGRSMTALTPAQEAELKAATKAFVPAPSDDPTMATKPCPICKELFKSEWSEEEEEWIWKNAVKVNGIYYHGSCHYSAKTLSYSVKQSSATGSREGTPLDDIPPTKAITSGNRLEQIKEENQSLQTLQVAGTKRKAEESVIDKEVIAEENSSKVAKQESTEKASEAVA